MIKRVRANREEFNTVQFTAGFNVVLADRTLESTRKDSRNGLGKTTLVEIIHFCLGADTSPKKGLRVNELEGWIFTLDIVLLGNDVTVSRGTDNPGYIVVDADSDWSQWVIQPYFDKKSPEARIKISDWNRLLGWAIYNLSVDDKRDYVRKFRSLISYDIRRKQFDDPFQNHPRQYVWDLQVHNAFMLDLNWEYARRWQLLRERKNHVDNLKRATKGGKGLLANILGTIGELENDEARLERLVEKESTDLQAFRVHPQYEQIENEANDLTHEVHQLTNTILHAKQLTEFHERSLEEEQAASDNMVAELYEEAGVILPNHVIRTLEDVQEFHNQVTQNRRNYLQSEIARLRNEMVEASSTRQKLSTRRARLMDILETHGALAEHTELQQLHLEHLAQLEAVRLQIDNLKKIEREGSQIKIERESLFLDARSDYDDRVIIHQAREIFNSNSEALYEAPGDLIVDIKQDSGYAFRVDIKRSGSDGIDKMKVFCYDLMRAELMSQQNLGAGFLIHDSTIFADVDERQIARALELAAEKSEEHEFQYIVLLNSDKIPWNEFSENFELDNYVCLTLTDGNPEGSLLGIRF